MSLLLLPLNRRRGLAGNVIDDAADTVDFIDDAIGGAVEDIVRNASPFGGHEVVGGDGAKTEYIIVGTVVAHYAYSGKIGKDSEILTNRTM